MKKILCFLAVLLMLFGISAQAKDDTQLYESLGIILPQDTNETLTRGDFARMAESLIRDEDKCLEDIPFYDVPEESNCYGAVSCLYAKSIIDGTGQNLFSPDAEITSTQACAVLVRILGYDFVDNIDYRAKAGNIGLLKGVKFNDDDTLSYDAAKRMIYNALETEAIEYSYDANGLNADLKSNTTYLESYFDVHKVSGIVNDNGMTSLYGATKVGKDYIVIGEDIYKNESGFDYLGCEVEAWYVAGYFENTIKYMSPKYENSVVEFNAKNINDFADGSYKVETGTNKEKIYRISDTYKIIYNEKLYEDEYDKNKLKTILVPEIGTVKLADNNNDSKYDVIIVKSYDTFVVSGTIESTKTIIDKIDSSHTVSLNNVEDIDIKSANGAKRDFVNILNGEVVSVAVSNDRAYAEVIISEKKVNSENIIVGDDYVSIDGTEYDMTKSYIAYINNLSVSRLNNAEFYLDFECNVAYHILNGDKGTIAYLVDVYRKESGDGVILKVVTENNELLKLDVAEKVSVDGTTLKGENQFEVISSKEYGKGYLISYRQNDNSEITNIDFPYYQNVPAMEDVESFHIIDGCKQTSMKLKSSKLGNYFALESDAKVWIVPADEGAKEITVVSPSSSAAGAYSPTLTVTAYSFDEYSFNAPYVVVSNKKAAGIDLNFESFASNQKPTIVKEIYSAYKNDEVVNCLVLADGGQYREVYTSYSEAPVCAKSGKNVRVGDMIRYGTDKAGLIPHGQIVVMYSPEDDVDDFEGMYFNNGDFDNANHALNADGVGIIYGYAYAKNSKYLVSTFKLNPETTEIKNSDKNLFSIGAMSVVTYDRAEKEVAIGTTDDILAFRNTGIASQIVMNVMFDSVNVAYVIKED